MEELFVKEFKIPVALYRQLDSHEMHPHVSIMLDLLLNAIHDTLLLPNGEYPTNAMIETDKICNYMGYGIGTKLSEEELSKLSDNDLITVNFGVFN